MPARLFTVAGSDKITLSLGALGFAFGPGSMAFIFRLTNLSQTQVVFSAGATNTVGYRLQATTGTGIINVVLAGGAVSTTALTSGKWYCVGYSKATGTATARFHIYDYAAGTWVHENASATQANSSVPVTRAAFGSIQAVGSPLAGDIAMGGVWNVVLSDSQFEPLAYDLNGWFAPAQPKGLWLIDQDATTQNVIDQSGNGANQSGLTATALSTGSVPVFSRGAPMVAA